MSDDKRVSVSFGAFSCEIIGYEDPIAVLNRVVGAMSAAAEADPDFGAVAEIDESGRDRVAAALTADNLAFDAVESDPEDGGLYVVAAEPEEAQPEGAEEQIAAAPEPEPEPEPTPEASEPQPQRRPLRIALPPETVADTPEAETEEAPEAFEETPAPIRATASFAALSPFRQTEREAAPAPAHENDEIAASGEDAIAADARTSSERAADGVKDALGGMARIFEIAPGARAAAEPAPAAESDAESAPEQRPEPPMTEAAPEIAPAAERKPEPPVTQAETAAPAPETSAEPQVEEPEDAAPGAASLFEHPDAPEAVEPAPKPRRSLAGLLRRRRPEHDPADDVAEEPLDPAMVDARLNQLAEEPPETEDWDDGPSVPIRFRRVEAIDDALLAGALSPSLFAQSVHAASLQDLLEASAVYMSLVEGRMKFSRRDVMVALNQIGVDREYPQQARLKTFRKLLTSGVLVRVDDGMYAISPGTRGDYEEKLRA